MTKVGMEFMLEKVDGPPPVKPQPPRRPPPKNPDQANASWPSDDDLRVLTEMWIRQAYAGYTKCCLCDYMGYCHGATYEKKMCFDCFIVKHKPKRKYTRRK